jgi:UDP-N-acetylmuramoyl-L-alanyl-D-glutamate--2,6-diaminopimelate ligase
MKTHSTLGALTAGLPGHGIGRRWQDAVVCGIVTDSRDVVPGDLFVALPGTHTHGMTYVEAAFRQGAAAVLLPQDPPYAAEWVRPGFVSPDVRRVLSQMAARLYGFPGRRLRLVGVTGTNGKTTVVYLIAQLLRAAGRRAAFWSTARVEGGGHDYRPRYTTPEAPALHEFLADAAEAGEQDVVLEVSSHALTLHRVADLQFHVGVVTNVTPDHLDFHPSFDAYAAAKRHLIEGLPATATAILNADDPVVAGFSGYTAARVVTYGLHAAADVTAEQVQEDADGIRFRLRLDGVAAPVKLWLPGRHNVSNLLAAAAAAHALGVEPSVILAGVPGLRPPVRRLEPDRIGPYTVINDVAMNQASYDAVLAAVAAFRRPLVVVNALRGNRGPAVNRDAARVLAAWAKQLPFAPLIVTASDRHVGRLPVDYRVRPEEWEAFLDQAAQDGLAVDAYRELDDALEAAAARLQPGGILLLLGTFGMDDGPELAHQLLARRWATETGGESIAR